MLEITCHGSNVLPIEGSSISCALSPCSHFLTLTSAEDVTSTDALSVPVTPCSSVTTVSVGKPFAPVSFASSLFPDPVSAVEDSFS